MPDLAVRIHYRKQYARDYYQRAQKDNPKYLAKRKARYQSDPKEYGRLSREYYLKKPWVVLVTKAIHRAKQQGLPCDLTKEWAAAKWTGKCEITGVPFRFERGQKRRFWAPSIDRIIPEAGYTQDNCRFVLWAVNCLKGVGSDAEMYEVARLITESTNGRK